MDFRAFSLTQMIIQSNKETKRCISVSLFLQTKKPTVTFSPHCSFTLFNYWKAEQVTGWRSSPVKYKWIISEIHHAEPPWLQLVPSEAQALGAQWTPRAAAAGTATAKMVLCNQRGRFWRDKTILSNRWGWTLVLWWSVRFCNLHVVLMDKRVLSQIVLYRCPKWEMFFFLLNKTQMYY